MNPYESGQRKVIPAVLVYISRQDKTLMIYRNSSNRQDDHLGKWNGLGGKLELNESPVEAAIREVQEEAGLQFQSQDFQSLGFLQFPNFKPHKNEDWLVFVFSVDMKSDDHREPQRTNPEGELHWKKTSELLSLNLWPGDRHFVPNVIGRKPMLGTIWYQNSEVARHSISLIHPEHRGSF